MRGQTGGQTQFSTGTRKYFLGGDWRTRKSLGTRWQTCVSDIQPVVCKLPIRRGHVGTSADLSPLSPLTTMKKWGGSRARPWPENHSKQTRPVRVEGLRFIGIAVSGFNYGRSDRQKRARDQGRQFSTAVVSSEIATELLSKSDGDQKENRAARRAEAMAIVKNMPLDERRVINQQYRDLREGGTAELDYADWLVLYLNSEIDPSR